MKKVLLAILLFAGIGITNALAQQQEVYYVNCWKCNGLKYTSTTCPSCNGRKGSERFTYRDCRACKGTGYTKELAGYVDGQEVYKNIRCRFCNGTCKEKESVEWIPCPRCNGTGESRHSCDACNGTGTIKKYRNKQ